MILLSFFVKIPPDSSWVGTIDSISLGLSFFTNDLAMVYLLSLFIEFVLCLCVGLSRFVLCFIIFHWLEGQIPFFDFFIYKSKHRTTNVILYTQNINNEH